ncbi:disulfide bond formation protein DsbA [Candidatus Uhrbacteria bacterium CG_4_9_14_0_2_um_filter_41_50]|uniref:Disulfide bond formation protein DsbA n=1 Tax=Candidatus Uhrbacteria bacterium CG_4_9_14_0_2_um_filter_41_50 TaxID=1975031 RepID=A0A2M8EN69_9BACT|nr:MAG: disulfide bond formation protein DsbA [Candidatus Uhrbacteria bacterium CG_4_10_14_3_um_filter_41_21]PIZ54212.1 MAG: disulfide bond formation protein DsbA [Candidatus Uhrbacteria bacterium CG_4_10_14_0_2_um_filter_41_21]PJB84920.1 MAG: disulfide bond formation protein DsbA [Candidatus Uhrbacteria bacterium CG_4_9_14_0_8_um_filter_41_16]PJC24186.1 MAG: disulfide bond formation protein DsbA [Candidatus Uhrbacteria bacterium CG_4_9_14_0_2_um_filter_41_50]PJE74643.1 MAG: disulfide bond form
MTEENKGFFNGNPKMIFLFGLVAGIAITMILSGALPTFGGQENSNPTVVIDDSIDDSTVPAPTAVLAPVTDEDHVLGDINKAKVILIEYSDFECPYCERHHPTMQQIYDTYGDDIAWVYRHFPLSFHPDAEPAALASECAAEQGKFWEYADDLFTNQDSLGDDLYLQLAADLGLDVDQFTDCYDSEKYADKLASDYNSGVDAGVTGTPATYVNGQKVSGAVPYETFQTIIESYLTK